MTEGHTERLESALAGRYKIERKLGEGGMASVYLAEDIKHHRKVALKILKPELAAVIGAERFLSEIRTTANLQHPHILALFDSGEAAGYLYYVMPYIEGETLREKLEREKQLGVEESIRIARDVADALDYAHRQGVIHRDIKPANILLHDGRPVVADFGIALAVAQAGGGRMTATGLSLGTPHYMSPEQAAADRDLSARSDVYSLGCVLYEMIGGQPPHTGPSAQSILVHILTEEATPLTKLRHTVPPHVAATVSKAIEKLPADRFETAKAFMDALGDEGFTYKAAPRTAAATTVIAPAADGAVWARQRKRQVRALGASLTAVVVLAVLAAWGWLRPTPAPAPGVPTRVALTSVTAGTINNWTMAISPDGSSMVVLRGIPSTLYLRTAADPEWRLLANTGGALNPTFSPDGQSVAFNDVGGTISKVPVTGGPAFQITSLGVSPHWGLPDAIVYTDVRGTIYRLGASGGEPEVLLEGAQGIVARRPFLLPDGKGVVFGTETGGNDPLNSRILYLEIETGEVRELVASGNQPRYVSTGHLIYGHGSQALMGVPFDVESGEVTGDPTLLLPSLTVRGSGASEFAVSETGTLIYDPSGAGGNAGAQRLLVEVDMEGVETPIPLSPAGMDTPRYSPDGGKIAYTSGGEVRVYDVVTGANPEFGTGTFPVWSPSGEYLYNSLQSPTSDSFRRPADGREERVQLWSRPTGTYVTDVSAGDSIIVVRENADGRGHDLLLMREGPDSAEFTGLLTAEWNESNGVISPDERWIAYQSDESGEYRIYVHSFPVITGRYSVSPGQGTEPVWAPDGRTLYYRSDSRFLAVDVATAPTFEVLSTPTMLFDRPAYASYFNPGLVRTWDIHPDGSRFVMVATPNEAGGGANVSELYIVTNWFTELRERMGEN